MPSRKPGSAGTGGMSPYLRSAAPSDWNRRADATTRTRPSSGLSTDAIPRRGGQDMSGLLRKPFGVHGKVHDITPESANWRYVGFSLYRLRAGERVAEATGTREVILVMIEGKARF